MTSTALTLNSAAKAVNRAKATLLKAIKTGRLSAAKDDHGVWMIEPVELYRVYPVGSQPADTAQDSDPGQSQRLPGNDYLWRERLADLERERAMMLNTIEDLRRRLDGETEERRRLMATLAHETQGDQATVDKGFFGRLFK